MAGGKRPEASERLDWADRWLMTIWAVRLVRARWRNECGPDVLDIGSGAELKQTCCRSIVIQQRSLAGC